jgi:hypothetical protein
VAPRYCAAGTMTSDSVSCTTCTAGYYCGGNGWVMPCGSGTYSEAGATECTVCPANHYCSTTAKNPCPAKTYSPERSSTLAQCVALNCQLGQIDIDGRCAGCPANTVRPPYSPYFPFTSLSQCITCPAGTTPMTLYLVPDYISRFGRTACMYPCPADAILTNEGCSFRSSDGFGIVGTGRDIAVPTISPLRSPPLYFTRIASTDMGYVPFST